MKETSRQQWWALGIAVAIIFFTLLLRYHAFEDRIVHSFPIVSRSADANSRISEADYYAQSGQTLYQPSWFDDEYDDILEIQPPLNALLAAQLSQFSGIEPYDLLYFVSMLGGMCVAILFFLIFWKLSRSLLLGAIAGFILVYPLEQFYQYQILIGHYGHFTQIGFLALMMLFLIKFTQDGSWRSIIGLAYAFAVAFYAHSINPIYIAMFSSLVFLYLIIRRKATILRIASFYVIGLLLIAAYLPLVTSFGTHKYTGEKISLASSFMSTGQGPLFTDSQKDHPVRLASFLNPIYYILLIIGIIGAFTLIKDPSIRLVVLAFAFFFAITMLIAFLGVTGDHITHKPRYVIFVFAYPVVAIGAYLLLRIVSSKVPAFQPWALPISVAALVLLLLLTLGSIAPVPQGVVSPAGYAGYLWVRDNTPLESRVLCIGCVQFEGLYTHRVTYLPSYEINDSVVPQLVGIAQSNGSVNMINTHVMGHGASRMHRVGWSTVPYGEIRFGDRDICSFDYVIFKELGQLTPIISSIAERMSRNNTVVYGKDNVIIMKNLHVGGVCI